MVLMIDNYDSFTYNVVQYCLELGADLKVVRNDEMDIDAIAALKPEKIIISPGPATPDEAGVSLDVVRTFHKDTPIFGICLGHQTIAQAFGGRVVRAKNLMHGKTSTMEVHIESPLFKAIPETFTATRYHSLIVDEPLPDTLIRTAWTEEGELMGLRHKEHPTFGLQFHPESILTEHGHTMLKNFLEL